ncbi:hypothetical protein J3R82DRAFT_7307 [Butyriboletus roseoflavus]|nr:hypothetical protein J3R82DRAFT_7307 [Butyriboletus roseoflavus]
MSPDVRFPALRPFWSYFQSCAPMYPRLSPLSSHPALAAPHCDTPPPPLSMYRPSNSNYKSWTSTSSSHSAPSYPTTSPGPMPSAPHPRTVSLPHPNSAPSHPSSSSSSPYHSSFEGSSRILSLNPLLAWTGVPPLYYNVTRDVENIQLQPGCPPNLLYAPAVHPVCTHLVLSVPSLPMRPTIEVRNSHGVTVRDVLVRIREVLDRSVSHTEMAMVSIFAATASEYFRVRTLADPREFAQGVKRIDFLGPNVFFAGLSRSMNDQDRWEVRFV